MHPDRRDASVAVDERGAVVLRERIEQRREVGSIGEVERRDLDGRSEAKTAELAGVAVETPTIAAPILPAPSQWVENSTRLASTSASAPGNIGAMRSAMRTLSGLFAHRIPSHVAISLGVVSRTQP